MGKYYTDAERLEFVKNWKLSGKTIRRFAKEHNMCRETLREWANAYKDLEGRFVRININDDNPTQLIKTDDVRANILTQEQVGKKSHHFSRLLFGRDLIDLRHNEELPSINQIHDLVFNYTPKQGSAFESAINYTRKVWDDLLPYLDEPYLELSNNLAERCVKPFVVNRKVFQTSGSEAGAIYTVKLFSIIRTAIINGLDPYRYIKYVLENIKNKPIDDLLPYSKSLIKLF